MRRLSTLICVLLVGVGISLMSWFQVQAVQQPLPGTPQSINPETGLTCNQIISQVMSTVEKNCIILGRNNACYANPLVNAELNRNAGQQRFDVAGDILPIQAIKSLQTTPLDVTQGTWGVSVLKLQANLPDTLPGQNVTFLVYGDTQLQNIDGKMRSFYFTTGLGNPSCGEAPSDA